MFRNTLKPLCLIGLCVLTAPAFAQSAATTQQLVSQGNYWQDQGREDLAAEAWRKLLAADPHQPDALLGLGMIDLNQGRRSEAQKRLQQLQARHAASPQATRLRMALGGSTGNSPLNNARRAAAAGQYVEAVSSYEEAFGSSNPPADLALEYYQVLAGTPEGWTRARDGLRRLAGDGNKAARLALAQVLTYREPSRREGIAQLSELSQAKDTAGPARAAWRQALLWLNASSADAGLYQAYLAQQPNDREVAAKQSQLRSGAAAAPAVAEDPNKRLLGEGFKALDGNDLAVAEARFAAVLRARARDAEAQGGLGSVRLRQERFAEAYELLRPAAASQAKWKPAANTARYWLTLQEVRRNPDADGLERVRQVIALLPKEPAGYVALADLQVASDVAGAEANYRKALTLDGANAGALQGLVGLMGRQGRADEAAALFERLTPSQQEAAGGASVLNANLARARAQQALAQGQAQMAQIELEDALLAQTRDPWIRLDLARLYRRAGRIDQAERVMADLQALDDSSAQALHAQALYAREKDDWAQVYAQLERIPAAGRDAPMRQLRDVAWVHLQGAQARALMARQRTGEAQLLLARAESALAERSKEPAIIAALAGAYADIGSQQRAIVLAQTLVEGRAPGVEERLEYAGVLLRAGRDGEVAAVLRQLADAPLSDSQRTRVDDLRAGYVLRQVDALRELGNLEGAYSVLAPALAEHPQDPRNIAALARLYAGAGDHSQALALYQQQLALAPNDIDGLVAAAGSAGALRDLDLAQQYLDVALARAPQSPEVLAAAGRIYRAAGKNRRAESYFRASLAAAARGAGQLDNGYPQARTAFAGAGAAAFNPFAGLTHAGAGSAARAARALPVAALPAASVGFAGGELGPMPGLSPLLADDGLPAPVNAAASSYSAAVPVVAGELPVASGAKRPSRNRALGALPAANSGNAVLDELRAVRSENSSSLAVGTSYRTRAGEPGLGKVNELQVPMEAQFALGDGKLKLAVTPVVLDAGQPDHDYLNASRFGAGPQAALAGALAADRSPVDALLDSSLYQVLLSRGDTTAARNMLYERALDNGRFQELFNQTDGALTQAERRAQAMAALYADPLPSYILSRDLANSPIKDIASQVLANSSLMRGLTAGELAQLKALAQSSAATQTPLGFEDTLNAMVANAAGARRMSPQDATGAGIAVAYEQGGFHVDVGTTPLGFDDNQIVGGVGYRGQAGDSLTWSADASRRAVTDSMLSFAGVEDTRSGMRWGGVTATGAKVAATLDNGVVGGYANASWHRLEGENVASNDRQELGIGIYVHALDTGNQSLTAGLNVTAMQYDRNLSGFTFGHGGYFSPQRYLDVGFPVHWNGRSNAGRVTWQVDGSVGVQHFKEEASPYFPTDPALQQAAYDAASMAGLLGFASQYVEPVYTGQTKTGLSYNLSAATEWQLSSQLFLGGRVEFNNARDYRQFGTNLYVRFLLDRLGSGLGNRPYGLRSPYAWGN